MLKFFFVVLFVVVMLLHIDKGIQNIILTGSLTKMAPKTFSSELVANGFWTNFYKEELSN